jgi:hypothetical protein
LVLGVFDYSHSFSGLGEFICYFTTNLISVTKGIISLLQNPGNTLSVYDIEDGLKESWLQRLSLQYVKSDPGASHLCNS